MTDLTEETVEDQEHQADIGATMEAVFDRMEAESEPETPSAEAPAAAERDEAGRFKAKEKPEDGDVVATKEEITPTDDTAERPDDEPEPLVAPDDWSETAKALWEQAPRELQEHLLSERAQSQTVATESAEKLKGLDPIRTALDPVRQRLSFAGVDEATYIRQLVAADEALRKNPREGLQWIVQAYGLDPTGLVPSGAPDDGNTDPQIAALKAQVTQLTGQLSGFVNQQQVGQQQQVVDAIDKFSADPANTHWAAVENDVVALMPAIVQANPTAGPQDLLKMAYERAVKYSDVVQNDLRQAEELRRKAEDEKKAAEARKIARLNVGTVGASSGESPQGRTIEESLAAAYDRAQGA